MGSITFTGLASGMDTSTWIEALVKIKQQSVTTLQNKQTDLKKSQSTLNDIKSKVTTLRSSIEKITDSKLSGSFDVFAKNTVSSTNKSVVDATVTADAARQNLDIVVNKLATATTATSKLGTDGLISEDTKYSSLAAGKAKNGAFSIYVDGTKSTVDIAEDDTMGDIINKISAIDGISASIVDGKVSISAEDGKSLVVGASTDEANFASVVGLVRDADTGNYESYTGVSKINTSAKLVDIFGDSVKGTMTVGNATFTIDENTTMKSLIGTINRSEDAGVTAYWDASAGEMVMKSKTEGAFSINVEAGTSNFTNILGLTTGQVDENGDYVKDADGNYVSALGNQVLGDYAQLSINGTTVVSSSNTVTSDISGIEGLTLTLKSVSKPNDDNVVEPTTISVEQDQDALLDTVKAFVDAYNNTISSIDNNTSYGDALYGETSLTSFRNNLRRTATASIDSDAMKLLSDIGITTGAVSNTTSTSSVNKLQIDEKKFKEALAKDPDGVKKLFVGDNKGNATSGGVLNKLEKITEDSLQTSSGYFDAKSKSYEKRLTDMASSITREQSKVDAYQTRLQKQFNNMETLIASIQKNYSQLSI